MNWLILTFSAIAAIAGVSLLAYSYLFKPRVLYCENGFISIINGRAAPVVIFEIINQSGRNDIYLKLTDDTNVHLGSEPYLLGCRIKPYDELVIKFAAVSPGGTASFGLERSDWRFWETVPTFNLVIY